MMVNHFHNVERSTLWCIMQQIINLREINQNLSKYIRSLESGDDIVITKHGKPVARLVSFTEASPLSSDQKDALKRLRGHLKNGFYLGGKGVDRDSLYER